MTANGAGRHYSVYTDPLNSTSTVIIGAGIIGCATAYHLAQSSTTRSDAVHLIEASPELFASASGKAAGFLASDWFGPSTASLGELSFRLHKELAEQHDGHKLWGYSRSTGSSLVQETSTSSARGHDWLRDHGSRAEAAGVHEFSGPNDGPAWLTRARGDKIEALGEDNSVGQVDPLRLSQFLLRQALFKGVRLHQPARPIRLGRDGSGRLSSIRIRHAKGSEHRIPCTRLLIAAGAWSGRVFATLFPESRLDLGIGQLAGHSVVVKSPRWKEADENAGCHAVFTTTRPGFSPEIFSRIGGEIYIAGLNDETLELPELPTDANVDPAATEELMHVAQRLLGDGGTDVSDLQVVREGLCFRPITSNGFPILSRVKDEDLGKGISTKGGDEGGVFIAAGHGPWGISHSLGTGKVMAEMIENKRTSADVKGLAVSR